MSAPAEWHDLPGRSLPRFGSGAFRGTIAPSPSQAADQRMTAPEPVTHPASATAGIRPVDVTSFSAGNSQRNGIVGIMLEFWRWRRPMQGTVFISPDHYDGSAERAMARPRRLDKVIPNREYTYTAPEYGRDQGDGHNSHRAIGKGRFR